MIAWQLTVTTWKARVRLEWMPVAIRSRPFDSLLTAYLWRLNDRLLTALLLFDNSAAWKLNSRMTPSDYLDCNTVTRYGTGTESKLLFRILIRMVPHRFVLPVGRYLGTKSRTGSAFGRNIRIRITVRKKNTYWKIIEIVKNLLQPVGFLANALGTGTGYRYLLNLRKEFYYVSE